MSRRDYREAAAMIARLLDEHPNGRPVLLEVARGMAALFAADNPRFSRQRFMDACGLEG